MFRRKLSTFDRVAIVVVTLFGTFVGLEIALASDIRLTPVLAVLFPGVLVGLGVVRIFGVATGVIACAVSNGTAYGFVWYGWIQLANTLARRLPKWLKVAARFRIPLHRR